MERPPVPYAEKAIESIRMPGWSRSQLVKGRSSWTKLLLQETRRETHVAAGEVTTLEHEVGDDAVEAGALVALLHGSLAELTEVTGSLGDILLVEVEVDAANLGCKRS